jgi:hypothetical protein
LHGPGAEHQRGQHAGKEKHRHDDEAIAETERIGLMINGSSEMMQGSVLLQQFSFQNILLR